MVGVIRGEEKAGLLRRCDVLARTSYHEVFPVVYLEAFSYGKPVVATPAGDTPVIARDSGAVRLVEPHRPEQVAEAILELMDNPELRARMGKSGLEYATASAWGRQSERLFSFVGKILAGG